MKPFQEPNKFIKSLCGWGAVLFVLSDGFICVSKFYYPIPYDQVINLTNKTNPFINESTFQLFIMSTYYLGQLGIALSVIELGRAEKKGKRK